MTNRAQLGMAMFLLADAVFFLLLILASAYFRATPHLIGARGWLLTALLIAGSLSIWRGWRWITFALGTAFCIGLFAAGATMLTGLHGLFVLAGVIAVAVVPSSGLRAMALYWYFFTAVWLVIFALGSLP